MRGGVILIVLALIASACGGSNGDGADSADSADRATPRPTDEAEGPDSTETSDSSDPDSDTSTDASEEATAADGGDGDNLSGLREQACDLGLLPNEIPEPECGFIEVPAQRGENGEGIDATAVFRLDVVRFPSPSENPMEPVVYLEGGPGGDVLANIGFGAEILVGPWIADRDVVLFTQRGTGSSEPELQCSQYGVATVALEAIAADVDLEREALIEELEACREQLVELGANLAAYNSIESAHDVEDLRLALNIEQWNVLGVSYGTRLAQTLMREHPDGIRSVILDSVVPLEGSYLVDIPDHARRAFDELFARCAGDTRCNSRYPNLEDRFFALADQLDESPVEITAVDVSTATLEAVPLLVTGDDLVGYVFQALYDPSLFTQVPEMIAEMEAGNTDTISSLATVAIASLDLISVPMNLSVSCHEEVPFVTQDQFDAATTDDRFGQLLRGQPQTGPDAVSFCEEWGAGTADQVEEEPISSDIPTLLLGGQFDPITPPDGMAQIDAGLANSYRYTFDNLGHGVIADGCTQDIVRQFLNDPGSAPDDACIANSEPPNFVYEPADIDFELKTIDVGEGRTVDAMIPVGWTALPQPAGSYVRGRAATDITGVAVLVDTGGLDRDTFIGLVSTSLGIDVDAGPDEVREIDVRTWDVYQGLLSEPVDQAVDVAVTEWDDQIVMVLVTTDPAERDDIAPLLLDTVLPSIQPN